MAVAIIPIVAVVVVTNDNPMLNDIYVLAIQESHYD